MSEVHPTDALMRFAAPAVTAESLTGEYEGIVEARDESLDPRECLLDVSERYGALQVIASKAIARVQHLEQELDQREAPALCRSRGPDPRRQ